MTDNTDPQATSEIGTKTGLISAHSDSGDFSDPILTPAQKRLQDATEILATLRASGDTRFSTQLHIASLEAELQKAQIESGQTETAEVARPDLDAIERGARMRAFQEVSGYSLTEITWAKGSVLPLIRYVRELLVQLAELKHSNASLLAANIEETARANKNEGWEYRALAAEAEVKALRNRLNPSVSSVVITQPVPTENAFGKDWWEKRQP